MPKKQVRSTHLRKRIEREGIQINISPAVRGRYAISLDPLPMPFKLAVADYLKVDPATFLAESKPKRTRKRKGKKTK